MTPALRTRFGELPDGRIVEAVTLRTGAVSARIINYGATLTSLIAPDRHGRPADIVLGHDDLESYLGEKGYLGATIGRYANRIAGGRFELDGREYQLPRNDGPNCLHGGEGFDRRLWSFAETGPDSVRLEYLSPDGEAGFPGTLRASVTYSLGPDGELSIEHLAVTDRPTIVNLTNHSYYDLTGRRAGLEQRLTIPAEAYTPVDGTLIPTGDLRPVAGTEFDFRQARSIETAGYDHNWVLGRAISPDPQLTARLEDPASGRLLELFSNQPGVQFYAGRREGICLEPQLFPDTPNRPAFGSARLDPGQTYRNHIVLRLGVAD